MKPQDPPPCRPRALDRLLSLALSASRSESSASGLAWRSSAGGSAPRSKPSPTSASLAPQNLSAVQDLNELQDTTGVSGQLDVSVEAPDLTDPATIAWMAGFKQRVLGDNGFGGENPSCLDADVCPGPALSDFLTRGGGS